MVLDLQSHLKRIGTLPRKNWMFNCSAIYSY